MKFFFFVLFFSKSILAFTIYAPERLSSDLVKAYNQNVILDIYTSIGINAQIIYIPEHKIQQRLKENRFDAVLAKMSDSSNVQNSIQINPPLLSNYKIYAWKRLGSKTIKKGIRIGAIKGVIAHTKTLIKNRSRYKTIKYYKDYGSLFSDLVKNKVDSIFLSDFEVLNELPFRFKKSIEKIPGALLKTNLNHYISIKHVKISEKLTKEFVKRNNQKRLNFTDFYRRFKQKKAPSKKDRANK